MDEASHRRRRSAQTCRRTARIASERAAAAAQEVWGVEAALRGAYRHALARRPGVLGDACGSVELERNERARLRDRAASFAMESAQVARPTRCRRGGDRLAGVSSSERPPANKQRC